MQRHFSHGRFAIWYYPPPLGKFCHRISSGGGGGGCHMVLFSPWGSSAMGFLPGECLPYGIHSWGQSAMVFVPLSRNVCGGIYHRGGSFTIYGIVSSLGKFCHGISSGGMFVIWYNFREGGLGGQNSHVTPTCSCMHMHACITQHNTTQHNTTQHITTHTHTHTQRNAHAWHTHAQQFWSRLFMNTSHTCWMWSPHCVKLFSEF